MNEYYDAMKQTGPINAKSIYQRKDFQDKTLSFSSSDFIKNRGKYDFYKSPSLFADDYKPYKGLEDLFDLTNLKYSEEQIVDLEL